MLKAPWRSGAEFAKTILEKDAHCFDVRDGYGATPLLIAAGGRNTILLKFLIEKGADVIATNHMGLLSLGNAIMLKSREGVEFLCQQLRNKNKPLAGAALPYACRAIPFLLRHTDFRALAKSGHSDIEKSGYWDILETVLKYYKHQVVHCGKTIDWVIDLEPRYVTGSEPVKAIWLGNFKIVGLILDSRKFNPDLRYLQCEAYLARFYLFQPDRTGRKKDLPANDERYRDVIRLLEDRDDPSYLERRLERLEANSHWWITHVCRRISY